MSDFLNVKAIKEFGKVKEHAHFIAKLERMSQDDSLNALTKEEVFKKLNPIKGKLTKRNHCSN